MRELLYLGELKDRLGFSEASQRWVSTRESRNGFSRNQISDVLLRAREAGLDESDPAAYFDILSFAAGVAGEYDGAISALDNCIKHGGTPRMGIGD